MKYNINLQERIPSIEEQVLMKVIINKIKCNKCDEIIQSILVRDFRFCKCGTVEVDGGHNYLRTCGNREN